MLKYGLLIFLQVVLLVLGQTFWKLGVSRLSVGSIKALIFAMFTPWIMAGIALYVVATMVSIYLLKHLPLSLVYPLQSLTYVLVILVSIFVFHEHISAYRWAGVGVILIGVLLVAK